MALVSTPSSLLTEIKASSSVLDAHLMTYEDDLRRCAGAFYGVPQSDFAGDPENHWQEWLSIFLPQLVFSNPQCSIETSHIEWAPERSKAIEFALNDWASMIELRADLERCAVDYAFRWSAGIVTTERVPGMSATGQPKYLPVFNRISPMDLRWDSTVKDWRRARWIAYRTAPDIADVIDKAKRGEKGWDIPRLERMELAAGMDPRDLDGQPASPMAERKQIVLWHIWVRGEELDDAPRSDAGFNGTWYTVCESEAEAGTGGTPDAEGWIRAPRPAFCPPTGPFAIQGALLLADLVAPVAPLVVQGPQATYVNKIARAIMRAVDGYKRGVATNSAKLAEEIESNPDMAVYSADGVDVRALISQFELGGLTQQMLTAKEDATMTLDRASGLHEAAKGNITGRATATEVAAAQSAGSARMGFLVEKFRDFVRQIYRIAAFYFDLDEDVEMDVGPLPEAIETPQGPSKMVRIKGGIPVGRDWSALDHEKLALRIDAHSMSRSDEQSKMLRFELLNTVLDRVATLGPQAVFVDWRWYLEQAGEAMGVRDIDRLIDTDLLYEVASMMLQLQQSVQPAAQPKPQPRFSWNTSMPTTSQVAFASKAPKPNRGPLKTSGAAVTPQKPSASSKAPVGAKGSKKR